MLVLLATVAFPVVGFAQDWGRKRPPITAKQALEMAEHYVTEQHLDVSEHFISSVRYHQSGSMTESYIGKGPYWQVNYELVRLSLGGEHFIYIYMDGAIGHLDGR